MTTNTITPGALDALRIIAQDVTGEGLSVANIAAECGCSDVTANAWAQQLVTAKLVERRESAPRRYRYMITDAGRAHLEANPASEDAATPTRRKAAKRASKSGAKKTARTPPGGKRARKARAATASTARAEPATEAPREGYRIGMFTDGALAIVGAEHGNLELTVAEASELVATVFRWFDPPVEA